MPVGVLPGLVLLAAAAGVQVDGATTCPTPEMVMMRLRELLPGGAGAGTANDAEAPQRARLSEDGGELVVVLQGAEGEIVGTRRFARSSHACDGLASAVAVSVAVWASDVHPAFSSSRLAPVSPPAVVAHPAVSVSASASALSPPATGPAPGPWRFGGGLGLGFGGSVDVPVAAADLLLDAWVRPPGAWTSVRVELEGQSDRQVALQAGRGFWRRWILGLGLERTLLPGVDAPGTGWLRGFVAARVAVLDLHGEGFATNHRERVFDAGAAAGVRAVQTRGRWATWVELAAALWPLGHDVVAATGASSSERLPAFEAFVRVGAGWGAGR